MGGVDRSDQLRAYHTCSHKSQYWWKKILFFTILVDIARVNAYIAYKQHHHIDAQSTEDSDVSDVPAPSKPLKHSQFVLSLAMDFIDGYADGSSHRQSKASLPVAQHNIGGHTSSKMPGLYPMMEKEKE